MGTVSEESCYSIVSVYNQKVREVQKNLIEWHEEQLKKLRIDPDKVKRTTKVLWIDRTHDLPPEIARQILSQMQEVKLRETNSLFQKDIQVIIKDGKAYYLPEEADKSTDQQSDHTHDPD